MVQDHGHHSIEQRGVRAVVRGATEALGIQAGLRDFNRKVIISIRSDATAAIGMVKRLGLGRVRHLSMADLWIQQRVRMGEMSMAKWPGSQKIRRT